MNKNKKSKLQSSLFKNKQDNDVKEIDLIDVNRREKYLTFFVIIALFIFSGYVSTIYFGHKVVPTSDYQGFVRIGHEILSLKIPTSFKRGPVVGLLQASLSYIVGGQTPDLTAGRWITLVLYIFSAVLLFLVGRKFEKFDVSWFALIIIINPWVISYMSDPIAEIPFLFFILLTFYFIFKHSSWSYVFASITTMVRYEGAALILAAFVMDMIYHNNRKQRLRAFLYSGLSVLPLVIWLLGTIVQWGSSENYLTLFSKESSYVKNMNQSLESMTGIFLHIKLIWQISFQCLLLPPLNASRNTFEILWTASKIFVFITFVWGIFNKLYKRQLEIIALLIFLIPYILIHSRFPAPLLRYYVPVFWMVFLICLSGLKGMWETINSRRIISDWIIFLLQIIFIILVVIWSISLLSYLPKISQISPGSNSLLYAAFILIICIFTGQYFIRKNTYILKNITIAVFVFLIVISNQFTLVQVLGDGQQDVEFKYLADWYVQNAKPEEKMAVYMCGTVQLFAPKYQDYFVGPPIAESPQEFIKKCHEENITYVVWASREGLSKDHPGYRERNHHVTMAGLAKARDIGPYRFITQIRSPRGYINIFRLN